MAFNFGDVTKSDNVQGESNLGVGGGFDDTWGMSDDDYNKWLISQGSEFVAGGGDPMHSLVNSMGGYKDDISQGFASQTGFDAYNALRSEYGSTPYDQLNRDQQIDLYGAWKGDRHSLYGKGWGSKLKGASNSLADKALGSESFSPVKMGSSVVSAAEHYGKALEAQDQMFNPLQYSGSEDWKKDKDKLDQQAFYANRDFTSAHPGATATAEQSREWGFDPMENLDSISSKVGGIVGGLGGPIAGGIAGGAAGWGLGSQFGEDEDYKQAYNAAGIGAGTGVVSGYMSGKDGGSSATGSEGQLMGDVASLKGAEAGITTGANAGGYVGATSGYSLPETISATAKQYASDPAGYAKSYGTDFINSKLPGGGTGMANNDWDWQDTISLIGDGVDMYGKYKAGDAVKDSIDKAGQINAAAGQYATQAYDPYMQTGYNALRGLEGMQNYDPTQDPQYQQQLAEMSRMMDDRSAFLGMGNSSADLKSRAAAGSGLYGQAYNREYNRLGDLSNLGRYGTTGAVNAQLGQANTSGNLALQGGNVSAGQQNALFGGIGDILAAPQQYQQNQQLMNYLAQQNRGY